MKKISIVSIMILCFLFAISSLLLSSEQQADKYITNNNTLLYVYMKKAVNAEGEKLTSKQISTYLEMSKSPNINLETITIDPCEWLFITEDLKKGVYFDWTEEITSKGKLAYILK